MKQLIKSLFILSIYALAVTSCTPSEQADTLPSNSGWIQVSLPYFATSASLQTRATQPEAIENRVENMYLLVFNEHGEKIEHYFFDRAQLDLAQNATQGTLKIEIPTGRNIRLFALANSDSDLFEISHQALNQITHWEQLQTTTIQLRQQTTARGSSFVMTGVLENRKGEEQWLNSNTLHEIESGAHTIRLKRIDAKVRFHIQTTPGVTFDPESWQIINLPSSTTLQPQLAPTGTKEFFQSQPAPFEDKGMEFSYYQLDNHQHPQKLIDTNRENAYQQREKQHKHPVTTNTYKPGQSVENGDFKYAPQQGTYVLLKGQLTYIDSSNRTIVADVSYRIHLGYSNKNPNDYAVIRNTAYLYKLVIQSAESILIEVNTGIEKEPGTAGHITRGNEVITVDSHYSTRTITFHYDDINYLSWRVNTPFRTGTREELFNTPHEGDSDWVLFLVNGAEQDPYQGGYIYVDYYRTFPGEKHRLASNATVQEIAINARSTNQKLMTATQLVHLLGYYKLMADDLFFDNNKEFKVTAYIQEFYYDTDPVTGQKDDQLWKRFVNVPERTLTFYNHTQFSPDGESSVNQALVSIRQHAIQTHYNRSSTALQTAWGTESLVETGPLPFEVIPKHSNGTRYYDSPSNGRKNTLELLKDAHQGGFWNTFINFHEHTLDPKYQAAKYACLLRNRDNNGDGKIDTEEIRWYLASINQLTDLWLGDPSLSRGAKLDQPNTQENQWYVSSTVDKNKLLSSFNNPMVLWSSEGSSTGYLSEAKKQPAFTNNVHYRCVRNLGIPLNQPDKEPQDIVQIKGNTIDLSHLDQRSIRNYTQKRELPPHHERSADNRPWTSFEVLDSSIGLFNLEGWSYLQEQMNRGVSICPKGYRSPNQRELALMQSRLHTGWSNYAHFSRTYYSKENWRGYMVNRNGERLHLTNQPNSLLERGNVRCVRDL